MFSKTQTHINVYVREQALLCWLTDAIEAIEEFKDKFNG